MSGGSSCHISVIDVVVCAKGEGPRVYHLARYIVNWDRNNVCHKGKLNHTKGICSHWNSVTHPRGFVERLLPIVSPAFVASTAVTASWRVLYTQHTAVASCGVGMPRTSTLLCCTVAADTARGVCIEL